MTQVVLFLVIVNADSSLDDSGQHFGGISVVDLPVSSKTKSTKVSSSSSLVLGRSSPCLYWALGNKLTCSRRLLEFTPVFDNRMFEKVYSPVNSVVCVKNLSQKNHLLKLYRQQWKVDSTGIIIGKNAHTYTTSLITDQKMLHLRLDDYLVIAEAAEIHIAAVKVSTRSDEPKKGGDISPRWLFNVHQSKDVMPSETEPSFNPIIECVLKDASSWNQLSKATRLEIMRTAWLMKKKIQAKALVCPTQKGMEKTVDHHHMNEASMQALNSPNKICALGDGDDFSDNDAATPSNSKVNSQLLLQGAAKRTADPVVTTAFSSLVASCKQKKLDKASTPNEVMAVELPLHTAASSGSLTQDESNASLNSNATSKPKISHNVDNPMSIYASQKQHSQQLLSTSLPPVLSNGETYDEKLNDALAALEDRSVMFGQKHLLTTSAATYLGPLVLGTCDGEGGDPLLLEILSQSHRGKVDVPTVETIRGNSCDEAFTNTLTTTLPPFHPINDQLVKSGSKSPYRTNRIRGGSGKRRRSTGTPKINDYKEPKQLQTTKVSYPLFSTNRSGDCNKVVAYENFTYPTVVHTETRLNGDESQEVFFRHT